jgi:DegV family protein with EDD domain
MPVRIVTDSTCDLPAETIAQYGIWVIPLYIHVGRQSYLDGVDISRKDFYTQLPSFSTHPTTAVPSPEKFRAVYNALADEGATEVISIHVSSAMSAIMDVAQLAAKDTIALPVRVLDSRQLSLGTGFLVETAAKLAAQGCSVGEIIPVLNDQIKRTYVFALLDTMEFLKRSGRVNRIVAGLGTLLQIKPIMKMHDGIPTAERVRTSSRAVERLIQMLYDVGPMERVGIVHSNAPDRVAELRQKASHLLPAKDLLIVEITPVIGAHTGPGAAGFAVVASKQSNSLF